MICSMEEGMLEKIGILDAECFDRIDNPRQLNNIKSLYENNPSGCYVVKCEQDLVGYVFTRIFGNLGYIGPLGVKPEFRKRGMGKEVVLSGIDALINAGCSAIGLEVMPELGNNVGLYMKTMFVPTYPTIMLIKKTRSPWIDDDSVVNGADIEINKLEDFNSDFRKEHNGYSFLKDINWALSTAVENTYFYIDKYSNKIKGFLCYTPDLYPFVWGALLLDYCNKDVFNKLFSRIEKQNEGEQLRIRVNSRYQKMFEMFDESFDVDRCFIRMMLKGYEGEFITLNSQSMVFRAWIG